MYYFSQLFHQETLRLHMYPGVKNLHGDWPRPSPSHLFGPAFQHYHKRAFPLRNQQAHWNTTFL